MCARLGVLGNESAGGGGWDASLGGSPPTVSATKEMGFPFQDLRSQDIRLTDYPCLHLRGPFWGPRENL